MQIVGVTTFRGLWAFKWAWLFLSSMKIVGVKVFI